MAKSKPTRRFRIKLIAYALAAAIVGTCLLVVSLNIQPSEVSEPATPSTAPAEQPSSPGQEEIAAQNLSGLILLFSLVGYAITIICIGWLVVDIRNARPAWKKHKKYRWQK